MHWPFSQGIESGPSTQFPDVADKLRRYSKNQVRLVL